MRQKLSITILAILLATPIWSQSVYPGQFDGKVSSAVTTKAEAFDLRDVRLTDSRFRENMQRDSAWLMSISADRLLHSFRTSAGVWAGLEGGYMTVKKLGGWESLDCELRGHTTGHILSASALMYAATGSECFKMKGDSLVAGLKIVQEANGNGYLSAFPEGLIDRNLKGQRVWAPWYTLHKILSGLIDQYLYAGNDDALQIAVSMADWAYGKLNGLDEDTRRLMIRNEFGGMPEAFWNLYSITSDENHKFLARWFFHNDVIEPLREGREDFGTKHTNTFIPKVIAEAREYEITGSATSRKAAEFFWHCMMEGHTFAPGCCSDKEHYFAPETMSSHISGYTGETCCTYNMLKLTKHIFCWNPSADVAKYYERALYNHILGQQDPQTGMVAYFLPLRSGSHKVYSTPENSFWCCVGSGFESHAKYAESIYFHNDDSLYVNLMIPSVLDWKAKGLTLTQSTAFPESEVSSLKIGCGRPVDATILIRCPKWCDNPLIKVNGRKIRCRSGEYASIRRNWKDGDIVELHFPMTLRLERMASDPGKAAIFYGPLLMAARLGTEGFEGCQPDSDPTKYNDYYKYDYHIPEGIDDTLDEATFDGIRRISALDFETPSGQVLSPLYDIHRERYIVYWNI
ncbi:MAG: glycoside hydrolase family 127 protein [Candidatus Cryptobacteroides sp.]